MKPIAWPIRAETWKVFVSQDGAFAEHVRLLENCLFTLKVRGIALHSAPLFFCPCGFGAWLCSTEPRAQGIRFPRLVVIGEGDLSADVQSCIEGYMPSGHVTAIVKGWDENGQEAEYWTAATLHGFAATSASPAPSPAAGGSSPPASR